MASTSASTSKALSSNRRINKAYVQVPVSPLSLASYRALKTPLRAASSMKFKENTPLRPLQFTNNPSMSLKRKFSDCDPTHDGPVSVVKKAKLMATDGTPSKVKMARSQPIVPTANSCADFPNGYVHCHQCTKKRDILTTIQCNIVKRRKTNKGTVERPCINKYCEGCLKKRYNEDLDVLQKCTKAGVASFFTCPRCKGICNCSRCKKVLRDEAMSLPGPHPNIPVVPKTTQAENKPRVVRTKANDIFKPPKKLPQLKWTPVPFIIARVQAEERIFIREFALRFSHIMQTIAKASLEELEFIAGKINDNDYMVPWVSETCLKGLLLGLLGLLAKDREDEVAKEIKTAIKAIRFAGVKLDKMWSYLVVLRNNVASLSLSTAPTSGAESSVPLTFPDPLAAPSSAVQSRRSLRHGVNSVDTVNIVHTAQMIPVIVSLIHSVLETADVREEIDQGLRDARDIARNAREATRIENEKWAIERKGMESLSKEKVDKNEDKAKGKAHKDRITDINNVMKLTTHCFTPRFSILGMDNEGRTYYALSPGVLERELTFEYLEVASSDKANKLKKKGHILAAEDRGKMKEWSWFVSVWGKKPLPDDHPQADTSDQKEDREEETEKWWGFWEPEEIVKVADWISIKSKLGDAEEKQIGGLEDAQTKKDPVKMQLKHLVTQLKDYAALLEWRTRDNKFSINDSLALEQTSGGKRLTTDTL